MVQPLLAVWWDWQREQTRPPSFVSTSAGSVNGRSGLRIARLHTRPQQAHTRQLILPPVLRKFMEPAAEVVEMIV